MLPQRTVTIGQFYPESEMKGGSRVQVFKNASREHPSHEVRMNSGGLPDI